MKNNKILEIFLKIISFPILFLEEFLIFLYKIIISPFLPHMCKFTPTCSTYFLISIKEYGVFNGSIRGFKRLIRCNPWSIGGFDPVKPNIKGKIKWIL